MYKKMEVDWNDARKEDPTRSDVYFVTVKWANINPNTFEVRSGMFVQKAYFLLNDGITPYWGWFEVTNDGHLLQLADDGSIESGYPDEEDPDGSWVEIKDTVVSWAEIPRYPDPYDPSKN